MLGLGYLGSGLLFAAAICVPAVLLGFLRANVMATFWTAYVLTRPLGASVADWLGVGPDRGGLGIGTGIVSLVLAAAIALCVAVFMREVSERKPPAHRSVKAAAGNVPV